jgi:hypothetical protein
MSGRSTAEVDLNFLARQIERLIPLRDDVAVLTAMVMRLDASQGALLQEVRAVHSQVARMNGRITKLGDAAGQ